MYAVDMTPCASAFRENWVSEHVEGWCGQHNWDHAEMVCFGMKKGPQNDLRTFRKQYAGLA
ncbi:hypothetical protein IMCC12053_1208 [Celeribacter marinus]|uniref:Uncharacterized protein n=1 Tax=Celeribacter marinus TaxID=1397108 RepID=A0A0P0AB21_9RHOB|nr:hypothetical protein IMCC12053_1208 [Celeribacter marinus]